MAFTSIGQFLGASAKAAAPSSVNFNTANANLTAGRLGIIGVAKDNASSTDGDPSEVTSITDAAGNTWAKLGEHSRATTNAALAYFRQGNQIVQPSLQGMPGGGGGGGGGGSTSSEQYTGNTREEAMIKAMMAVCLPCCQGSGSGGGGSGGGGSGSSGSGSGGGGLSTCCDCPTMPDTLQLSITVDCLGSRTVTLTKSGIYNTECVDNPEEIPFVAYSYDETNGMHGLDTLTLDCPFGFTTETGGFVEELNIELYCCGRTYAEVTPLQKWVIKIVWRKYVARIPLGQNLSFFYRRGISLVGCDPVVFEEIDTSVGCFFTDATLTGVCGRSPFGDFYDIPYTPHASCVGSTFLLNISE